MNIAKAIKICFSDPRFRTIETTDMLEECCLTLLSDNIVYNVYNYSEKSSKPLPTIAKFCNDPSYFNLTNVLWQDRWPEK